jgi:hypothetical protein
MGKPFPIRPRLPHTSHAYALGACHIPRHAITHEHRLVRSYLQSLRRRLEGLRMGFREQSTFPLGP